MVPLTASLPPTDLLRSGSDLMDPFDGTPAHYFVKVLELNEIISHITLSQLPASSSFAESLGLPPLYRNADSSAAVQMDECLNKLEKSLASPLSFNLVQDDAENDLNRQRILLYLR